MAYLRYEQITVSNTILDASDLSIPGGATHVELQASAQNVTYTMDGTNPTQTLGMFLLATEPPKLFLVEDLLNIKFVRGAASDGALNLHYFAGRAI